MAGGEQRGECCFGAPHRGAASTSPLPTPAPPGAHHPRRRCLDKECIKAGHGHEPPGSAPPAASTSLQGKASPGGASQRGKPWCETHRGWLPAAPGAASQGKHGQCLLRLAQPKPSGLSYYRHLEGSCFAPRGLQAACPGRSGAGLTERGIGEPLLKGGCPAPYSSTEHPATLSSLGPALLVRAARASKPSKPSERQLPQQVDVLILERTKEIPAGSDYWGKEPED